MKNLLKVFLGIFILLNLSGVSYATNYNTAEGYNNSGHSLAYQYMMAEKEKKQKKANDDFYTTIICLAIITMFFSFQFIWK